MGRSAIILGLMLAVAAIVWAGLRQDHQIVVSDAAISQMADGTIMAAAVITNGGDPDVLISASATGFGHAHFMGAQGDLVIPGGSAPVLAGDGAHIMMMAQSELSVGQVIPMVLTFRDAGKIATRAQVMGEMMDHTGMMGVEAPDVSVALSVVGDIGRDGLSGRIDVGGMALAVLPDGAEHVAGEGHGHLYLNGLKLQRVYDPEFATGALAPGDYVLRVSLNTNDHRAYLNEGQPVAAELRFTVD